MFEVKYCICPVLQVRLAMYPDGTMAIEVFACQALVQWPFLAELSLINAVIAVFALPDATTAAAADEGNATHAVAAAVPLGPKPWMYLNVVIADSQVFVPLFDMVSWTDQNCLIVRVMTNSTFLMM